MELRKKIVAEVDAKNHVPEIGQEVYCIYGSCLYVEKVYAIGSVSFIVASYRRNTREDFWEWRYDGYGKRWFTDLEQAKETLLSRYTDEYELVKYDATWYEVEKL